MSFSLKERRRSSIDFSEDNGLTEQSHKDSCDINTIMKRYERTGVLQHVAKFQGQYMDLPDSIDFHEAQNIIATSKSMFETVPAEIRAKFKNDPGLYIDFMQNPENRSAIEKMGLDASHLPQPEKPLAEKPNAPADSDNT